jgi:uncharacterized protein (TIGR02284 family)
MKRKSNSETAGVLNDLIQINNDRIEGYEKAAKELAAEDQDLRQLFISMIDESHTHKMALASEINVLGSDIDVDTTMSGKIYRAWMDVKAVFTGHTREAVLENCEFGEDAAQKAYEMALNDDDLPAYLRTIITEQKESLKNSHDKIRNLRDSE